MFKTLARMTLLSILALAAAACNRDSASDGAGGNAGPAQTVQRSVELVRQSDVAGLIEHMLPPEEFARVKTEWNQRKDQAAPTADERAQFEETMKKLTAENAVETLYAEFEPDIRQFDAQYQKQIPSMVDMGNSYLHGLVRQSQSLSNSEKEQADNVIDALSKWVKETRFTDPALVKQALTAVSETAKSINIKTLEEARALNYEQAAPKFNTAFAGLKKVFDVYGFSIDQTLSTVKIEVLSSTDESASLKVSYELLGTPLETTTEMVRIDDRWYGKDTIEKIREQKAEQAANGAVDAPAVED
ncbi:hypothetical protein [Dokdonella sp.]|uniref:hypothetical protein n=1 Tax=Dokdonella sp. TaxID=2291710 RepID=UPI003C695907